MKKIIKTISQEAVEEYYFNLETKYLNEYKKSGVEIYIPPKEHAPVEMVYDMFEGKLDNTPLASYYKPETREFVIYEEEY